MTNTISNTNSKWIQADTDICDKAIASGLAINAKTGEPLTFGETKKLYVEFDKVRSTMSIDEFLKDKVTTRPFDF